MPPTHELLESQSMGDLLKEMYEDSMVEREDIKRDLSREDGNLGELRARLASINEFLDDGEVVDDDHDPVIDKWERELLEGKVPDLDEGLLDGNR